MDGNTAQGALDAAADRGIRGIVGIVSTLCQSVVYPVEEMHKYRVDHDGRIAWPVR